MGTRSPYRGNVLNLFNVYGIRPTSGIRPLHRLPTVPWDRRIASRTPGMRYFHVIPGSLHHFQCCLPFESMAGRWLFGKFRFGLGQRI